MDSDADTVRELDGLSLGAAFRKFVLQNPEVVALGEEVARHQRMHVEVFKEGMFPGPLVDFRWPIDTTADQLASSFVSQTVYFIGDPIVEPSETIRRAAKAMFDQIDGFRTLLGKGVINTRGTFVSTGAVGVIDRFQWARSGVLIDIRDSDLLGTLNYRTVPRWTGVFLEASGLTQSISKSASMRMVTTTAAAQTACRKWLEAEMRASPHFRPKSKHEWWMQAQTKWGANLSQRAFYRVWDEGIRATNALAWRTAGAPKKSA